MTESKRVLQKERLFLGAAGGKNDKGITVDIDPGYSPDILHDLNQFPWPFKDNQFKEVICHHVLEHLDNFSHVIQELHRICSPEGTIFIEVPHFSSWQANSPHHKLRFSYFSLDNYLEGIKEWVHRHWMFNDCRFVLRKREITFHRTFRRFQFHRLFNKYPLSYERFWTYLFPAGAPQI